MERFINLKDGYLNLSKIVTLLIIFLFVFTLISPVYSNDLEEAERKKEDIERMIGQEEEGLEEYRTREETLKTELSKLDEEIRRIEVELIQIHRNIDSTERNIMEAELELADAEERLSYRESLLSQRLRVMHERGNVNFLEVLLESSSFAEFLTRFYYLQVIAQSDMLLAEEIKGERDVIIQKKEELEAKKGELIALRHQVTRKKEEVDSKIAERSRVLEELREEIEKTEQAIRELEEDAEKMAKTIEGILEQQRLERERLERERLEDRGNQNRPEGALLWPVESPYRVTSPYGWRPNPFGGGSEWHGGLDIATYGQPNRIFAAESGTVLFTRYSANGYGNHILIDHGGGMMTLYAHLRSISVGAGQSVSRGETIGRAGTTGASTGVHLHFEVWINTDRVDPYGYL